MAAGATAGAVKLTGIRLPPARVVTDEEFFREIGSADS